MVGRSHNVAAQATTLGKRFANAGEELLVAVERLEDLHRPLPAAGPQGAGRHPAGPARPARRRRRRGSTAWSAAVAAHLGFERVLANVGQVYPRSLDLEVVSALVQLVAGPSSLATTLRLMAGNELVTEGFRPGPGRLVGHAPQDERPQLRADQRVPGDPRTAT